MRIWIAASGAIGDVEPGIVDFAPHVRFQTNALTQVTP
jgi:hypothetical protein